MTCSSCAMRIERKLNKLEGVSATVNYATEKAKITFSDSVTPVGTARWFPPAGTSRQRATYWADCAGLPSSHTLSTKPQRPTQRRIANGSLAHG